MVWNKSGYHNNYTKQQLVIMDNAQKREAERKRSSEKVDDVLDRIIEHLKNSEKSLTLQEISAGIDASEIEVLKVLNANSKKFEHHVIPLEESDTSTSYSLR